MRYGIFGDIHGNLEALEAVLFDMQEQGVTHPLCLGDVVGYGADPVACLDWVQQLNCPVIKGNHDEEASNDKSLEHFSERAAVAMKWTREQLSPEQRKFLRELRYRRQMDSFILVHASLDSPGQWGYVNNALEASASFNYQTDQLCFIGHTHVPKFFIRNAEVKEEVFSQFSLEPKCKYLVNVGSVGQPRDGDWRASYAIYDEESRVIVLRRVPYDVATAQAKIITAGLPKSLADRLAGGL